MEVIKNGANFPNDRDYTLNAILEELALLERHCRDGSFKICRCIPEKHLPTLAGLSSEGFGFAKTPDEKEFMDKLMNASRIIREHIEKNGLTDEDANQLRELARDLRHRIEYETWKGKMLDAPELNKENCLSCEMTKAKIELLKENNSSIVKDVEVEGVVDMNTPRTEEERRQRHLAIYGTEPPAERQFKNRQMNEQVNDMLPTLPLEFGLAPPMPRGLAKKLFPENLKPGRVKYER